MAEPPSPSPPVQRLDFEDTLARLLRLVGERVCVIASGAAARSPNPALSLVGTLARAHDLADLLRSPTDVLMLTLEPSGASVVLAERDFAYAMAAAPGQEDPDLGVLIRFHTGLVVSIGLDEEV